jgi:hypothetical protein
LGDVVNWKIAGITLALVALATAGIFLARRSSGPPVTVAIRVAVSPAERSKLVAANASSARFKYMMAKQSGVRPVLSQKLAVKPVPNSAEIEATVRVETQEQGERYANEFLDTLQNLCGKEAQVTLVSKSVK